VTGRRNTFGVRPAPKVAAPETAMVMAAGLGKRMRPLTATRPKPLVTVAGKALIDHALDRLVAGGVKRVVVNVHYLADALEAHMKSHPHGIDIIISDERAQLMETGGGLMQAKHLIPDDPFLCVNSDNLWIDGPSDALHLLAARWDDPAMDALLLVVPQARAHNHSGKGDFHLDPLGRITRRRTGRVAPFVYTGIQMISKRLLNDAPDGPFSTMLFWERAIAAGRCFGVVHQGLWFDVGSPAAIPATEAMLADG
jgi:N-acetyl-alpha-D-muramate 1-phosphate uridylyltransferase